MTRPSAAPAGREIVARLATAWRRRLTVSGLLRGFALGMFASALLFRLEAVSMAGVLGVVVTTAAAFALGAYRTADARLEIIAHQLDHRFATLEASAGLLITDAPLGPLAALQRERAARALGELDTVRALPWRPLRRAALLATLAASASLAVLQFPTPGAGRAPLEAAQAAFAPAAGPAPGPGEAVEIDVLPPGYTGLPAACVTGLAVTAPEGSRLTWRLGASGIREAELVFADSPPLPLHERSEGELGAERTVRRSELYFLRMEDVRGGVVESPHALISVTLDAPPRLDMRSPEGLVNILPPGVSRLEVAVDARDDYGVASAFLVLTMASGSGEMVTFRERRLPLPLPSGADVTSLLTRTLDLPGLGLTAGSELYLFVEVGDNRPETPNLTRSETYIIRPPGDAVRSARLGGGLPVLLPAQTALRSQRQVILDTERLLADAANITRADFERRSQAIGYDQRTLRLGYGTLLGDELVFGEGHPDDADPAAEHHSLAEQLAGLVHDHDSEENATLFSTPARARLREALAAMWEAEGELRSLVPEAALGHEYRALRALKEAEERERVYVQKVGFEAAPIDVADHRLTGDLSDLPDRWSATARRPAAASLLTDALALLEGTRARPHPPWNEAEAHTLRGAAEALATAANRGVASALPALDALRAVRMGTASADEYAAASGAVAALLPTPEPVPIQARAEGSLFHTYLESLPGGRQ